MNLVIFPAVDRRRFEVLAAAAQKLKVINADSERAALAAMSEAAAFVGRISPALLAAAPRLEWVQSPTASLEHYLFPELIRHRCVLTNARGLYGDVVAEHAFALVLALARNLPTYVRQQDSATWRPVGGERHSFASGPGVQTAGDLRHRSLAGARLAIVGMGSIGRGVAQRAAAFDMEIRGVDPRGDDVPPGVDEIVAPAQINELLPWAEWWVIAAPHTPTSERMFDGAEFRAMRPDALIVNVGRGAVVDLAALEWAVETQEIAGCGLDVCEVEPLPPESRLWRRENVLITPHVAALAPPMAERHLRLLAENVRRFTAGEPLLNVVDKSAWC